MATYGAFTIMDYVVFIGTLLFSLFIGLYYACFKKQKTNKDFLVGGRQMAVFPIAMSLLATYMSAILVLGFTAEMYSHGTLLSEVIFSFAIFVPLSGFLFLPTFYKLQLTSVYEYLEIRFKSQCVRWIATITFIVQVLLYLGVVMFAPAVALQSVLHFPIWVSILCVGGCATVYTSTGGLRAVVWTDVFQILMYLAGLLAIVIRGSMLVGGIGNAIDIANKHERIEFLNFDPNPLARTTSLSIFFGQGLLWASSYGCHQTQVQRYCSMATERDAFKALLLNVPLIAITMGLASLGGVIIFANYAHCDPITLGLISRADQISPFFVVDFFSDVPGLVGLFVACLFSGALSTVSSGLNSLAAVTWEDVFKKIDFFKKLTEEKQTWMTKLIALSYGGVAIGLAFLAQNLGGVLSAALTVNGAVAGPLLGVFVLGLLLPFSNKWGAICGMLCGHLITFWISIGALLEGKKAPGLPVDMDQCPTYIAERNLTTVYPFLSNYSVPIDSSLITAASVVDETWTQRLYSISYLLYPLIGSFTTVLVGVGVSVLTGPTPMTEELQELISPVILRGCKCQRNRKADFELPVYGFENSAFKESQDNGLHKNTESKQSTNMVSAKF